MQVKAVDLDDPNTPNGQIGYSTVSGSGIGNDGSALFDIEGNTGWVTVKPGATLDRETQDTYNLRIEARDLNGAGEVGGSIMLITFALCNHTRNFSFRPPKIVSGFWS